MLISLVVVNVVDVTMLNHELYVHPKQLWPGGALCNFRTVQLLVTRLGDEERTIVTLPSCVSQTEVVEKWCKTMLLILLTTEHFLAI